MIMYSREPSKYVLQFPYLEPLPRKKKKKRFDGIHAEITL